MKTPFKILFLAVGCWLLAFTASAQVDVTKRGITPPHNIKNHDYTQSASKFGQMLGVKKFGTSAGDTLVGFLPVYYLGDSTLKVGAYTVVHSGNVTTYAPGTDLSYTASSRVLASSTGADATLPLFTSTEAGLVPLSGGGTSNFLRADGTWAAPVGSVTSVGLSMPTGFSVSGSPVTSSGTLAVSTTLTGVVQGNGSGLTASLGTANQLLRTNAGATAAEWFTPTYLTANQTITLSGDVTGSGSTAITTTIGTGAVTSAKILDGTIAAADLSAMGASSGQVMQWNGSAWVATTPSALSGGTSGQVTVWSGATSVTGFSSFTATSSAVLFPNGTAASPGIGFVNDINTGLFRVSSDIIGIAANGLELMRISGLSGNKRVAINTTNLNNELTVGGSNTVLLVEGSSNAFLRVNSTGASSAGTINFQNSGVSQYTLAATTSDLRWNNNAGTTFMIFGNTSGFVGFGIGSAPPSDQVQVGGNISLSGVVENADGTAGAPSYTFSNDLNTGLYRPTTDVIGFTTGGTEGMRLTTTGLQIGTAGSSAAPSISFTGDTNMGIYRAAADDLAIVAGGADIVRVNANGVGIGVVPSIYTLDITSTNAARIPGGTTAQRPTAAARLLRYNSDNETIEWNNGTTWYQAVTGTGSASRLAVWTGGLNLTNDAELGYNTTTNVLSVGGKIENAAGSAGAPTYTFTGDNTMGMYGSSGTLNWSTSGTLRMTMNTDGTTKLTSTGSATNSTINTLYYNKSSSAVDDDYLTLAYNLDDSGGNETTFGQIRIISENVTNGSEGGQFAFLAQKAGTLTQLATLDATSFSLNNLTPFKTGQFTATQASAISPQNGMLIYVTSTNATFTSVGHWARENGVWVKL